MDAENRGEQNVHVPGFNLLNCPRVQIHQCCQPFLRQFPAHALAPDILAECLELPVVNAFCCHGTMRRASGLTEHGTMGRNRTVNSLSGNIFRLKIPPAVGLLAIGAVVCACGILIFAKLNSDEAKSSPAEPNTVAGGISSNAAVSNRRSADPLDAFVDQITAVCSKANDGTKLAGHSLGSKLSDLRDPLPLRPQADASVEIRLEGRPETVLLYSRGSLKCITRIYRSDLISYMAELEKQFGSPCRKSEEPRPSLRGNIMVSLSEYSFPHAYVLARTTFNGRGSPTALTVTMIDRDYFADLIKRDLRNIDTALQAVRKQLGDFRRPERWPTLNLPPEVTFYGRFGEQEVGQPKPGMVWSSRLMAYALCASSRFPDSFENAQSNYPWYLAESLFRIEAAWIQKHLPPLGDVREVYEALPGVDHAPKLTWRTDDGWQVTRTPDRRLHVYRPLTKDVGL